MGKCKALFEFMAEQEGELSLEVGDMIITTAWVNDEWLQGICHDKEGIFPVQFVQILEDLPKGSTLISGIFVNIDICDQAYKNQPYEHKL